MAPRKRPANVVRSGNAGNSSKPKKEEPPPESDGPPKPPPLFPPGYKTPVTQLNEKCQKMGWERAIIETRQNSRSDPPTYSGSVTLRKRVSKNIYNLDEVRMVPLPPLEIPSVAMAKHYLATYALFRFCNGYPLALGLPPEIRPYWAQLSAEKAAAPDHRDWEWAADPFAAKKEVEERQARKKEKDAVREAVANGHGSGSSTPRGGRGDINGGGGGIEWQRAPEVKMATGLREMVEATVRKMMQQYPSAVLDATREASSTQSTMPSGAATPMLDTTTLEPSLISLGFRPAHVSSAISALQSAYARLHGTSSSMNDPLVLSLSILSPLEAAIEWLLLHLPEDDMPPRYRPSTSSADFVTGASVAEGGKVALVKGWIVDKLVKKAGFHRKAVEEVLADHTTESGALDVLGRRLCGWSDDGWRPSDFLAWNGDEGSKHERDMAREDEKLALEAVLGDRYRQLSATEIAIDIDDTGVPDQITLHVIFDDASPYPSAQYPTSPPAIYITSPTLPSYIRLYLHRCLLDQFANPERHDLRGILESGTGGALLSMVEHLETILPDIISHPPDVGRVTEHLVPKAASVEVPVTAPVKPKATKARDAFKRRIPGPDEEVAVKRKRDLMRQRKEYAEMMKVRESLPAWKERDRITSALEKSRVLVVVGETGCGKSTQLPQFILDHEIDHGRGATANILVTQPRRVAAIGVASRVANERLEDVDSPETVGYSIRGERRASRDTRLLFCTTGILLRRLGSGDPDLEGVSHVVVDEAHERGVDTDLFICLLRDLLERNKTIKIVLMSATINEQIFIDYFGGCPSLTIPGFTHPVTDYYLEDVIPQLGFTAQMPRFAPKLNEDQKSSIKTFVSSLKLDAKSAQSLEILEATEQIDYSLVAAVAKRICQSTSSNAGAILIFMPGVQEIKNCVSELSNTPLGTVEIMPLHANLTSTEQKRVFLSTGSRRKIVVATNVAETSVTIPDVVYVIDGGRVKETQFDAESGLQKLVEEWTSRASGRQRRGRAGRTQPGQCYKLYTRRTESNRMRHFPVPEILRTPLEALFLQVKAMDDSIDVRAFLSKAIDPPKMEAMDAAWQTLLDLGVVEGEDQKSRLTALGRHVSSIPVDVRLAKMIVLGAIFKCLDPILTVAALLSSKPLFTSPMDKRDQSKKARLSFARGRSDLLTDVAAYDAVIAMRKHGEGNRAIQHFCEDNFISPSTIRDLTSLRNDFLSALGTIGFIDDRASSLAKFSVNAGNDNLVKSILVGGLYPRVARIALPTALFTQVQAGAVQKDHEAKELKLFDQSGRVFIHPSSTLFAEAGFKSGFLAYFGKAETSKVFLRDATEVPLYSLLLFGGPITVNHWVGGLMLGKDGWIKLRANTRIGVLCSQLRRLLDAELEERIESPNAVDLEGHDEVVQAMFALLARDGLTQ